MAKSFNAAVLQQLTRIGDELAGIRQALATITAPAAAAPSCTHPEESRIPFGGMGDEDEFLCRACGQQFVVKLEAEPVGGIDGR